MWQLRWRPKTQPDTLRWTGLAGLPHVLSFQAGLRPVCPLALTVAGGATI